MDQSHTNLLKMRTLASGITNRQMQCVNLVAQGLTSKQIARELGISPSTVDNHMRAVITQLGVPNRIAAARYVLNAAAEAHPLGIADSRPEQPSNLTDGSAAELPGAVRFLKMPPIGGYRNETGIMQRFVHVIQISLLATMIFAAITATIAGIVNLFVR